METDNQSTHTVKEDVKYVLIQKDYMVTLINHILQMKQELKGLVTHIEEREKLLTAIEVRLKFGIGRDLLAHFRQQGLNYVVIGRKYFYRSSDIIEFARKTMKHNQP